MAGPNANVTEIIATTLRNRTGMLADNITNNNAILRTLKKRGNIQEFDGGRTMFEELFYQENSTYTRYSGYDILNVQPSDVISAAEYEIKQVAGTISISGLEQLQNQGKNAVIDLLRGRFENLEDTLQNGISSDLYSSGTADGGKQIGGLQLLVADTPTNTVGGIDRNTWTFFRNISFDATTDGGAPASAANMQDYMLRVWLQIVRGPDKPDVILADNNYYRFYRESLTAIQRISSDETAQAGFSNIMWESTPVVFDGGIGGNCPTNHMYFLNSKYLKYRPVSNRNFDQIGGDRWSINQDATVNIVGWAGNMTMRGGKFQAVLKD